MAGAQPVFGVSFLLEKIHPGVPASLCMVLGTDDGGDPEAGLVADFGLLPPEVLLAGELHDLLDGGLLGLVIGGRDGFVVLDLSDGFFVGIQSCLDRVAVAGAQNGFVRHLVDPVAPLVSVGSHDEINVLVDAVFDGLVGVLRNRAAASTQREVVVVRDRVFPLISGGLGQIFDHILLGNGHQIVHVFRAGDIHQVYTGVYECKEEEINCIVNPKACDIKELIDELEKTGNEVIFLGDGIVPFKDIIDKEMKLKHYFSKGHLNSQRAGTIGVLAWKYFLEEKYVSSEEFSLEYFRLSQAERERMNRG